MKLLHTADWQIGMNARSTGAAAERVRSARLEAGRRVVEEARDHEADLIVVDGNPLEDLSALAEVEMTFVRGARLV